MRKILAIMVVFGLAAGLAGCTKCSPKSLMKSEDAAVAVDAIGKTLAPAICEKYSTCNQSPEFNKDQCIQEISAGIAENLKTATDLKVTEAALDGCKKAIGSAPCEALNSTTPPTGCEFLQ
jgi:hypothetical protein